MDSAARASYLQLDVASGGAARQERCVAIRQWVGIERTYGGETGHDD